MEHDDHTKNIILNIFIISFKPSGLKINHKYIPEKYKIDSWGDNGTW